jgi:formylglycine-generating enzyme required for sulfatase activity
MHAKGDAVTRASIAAIALFALAGCKTQEALPPLGQLVLYLDTDAPLPSDPGGTMNALNPQPLFDRVRFDAIADHDAGACDCNREFDVTSSLVASGSISFGVLGSLAGAGKIRVRLFRVSATVQGEPDPRSTIDITFALPAAPSEGIEERTLYMPTDDVGTPRGRTSSVATSPGRPNPSHVGTWPGAKRKNCATAPKEGEVCVPGGAFWMGNVAAGGHGPESGDTSRLVIVSPFFVDETEMTVAAYRSLHGENDTTWSGVRGCDITDYCTWTASPGPNEALPMNCTSWLDARPLCQKQGKDLLSEAQYEYVASGLAGLPFVWGTDAPQCGDVVFERGGFGAYDSYPQDCIGTKGTGATCNGGQPAGGLGVGGPLPPRSGSRDRLRIALPGWTGTVFDIAGSVGELTLDRWNVETGSCWSRPGVYTDPVCDDPHATLRSSRGGDWATSASGLLAARRTPIGAHDVDAETGFRCARASK